MKKSKSIKILTTCMVALLLCLTSITSVFADADQGTEANPAKLSISKILRMSDTTATPTAAFTFEFNKISVDDNTGAASLATMPAISDATVAFTSADTGTSAGGLKTVTKETGNLLLSSIEFPHAGVYKYTVAEQAGTYTTSTGETMTYSPGEYSIEIYVSNGTSGLYISLVNVVVATPDSDTQNEGEKVTPTPGSSSVNFTNTYTKISGGDDPVNDSALKIGKTVTGNFSDQTKYFNFTVSINKTDLETTTPTYKLYLFDNGTIASTIPSDVYSGTVKNDGTYDYIEATAGTSLSVSLKHNQSLSVLSATAGTTYNVEETGAADYTPKASIVTNGSTPTEVTGTAGSNLSTGVQTIGSGANSANFLNTYKEIIVPTGISLDMLPFVILLALAGIGLISFIIVKSRKQNFSSKK